MLTAWLYTRTVVCLTLRFLIDGYRFEGCYEILALFSQVALLRGGNFGTGKRACWARLLHLVDTCARNQCGGVERSDSKLAPSPLGEL